MAGSSWPTRSPTSRSSCRRRLHHHDTCEITFTTTPSLRHLLHALSTSTSRCPQLTTENHEGSFTTNYYGSFTDNYYITVDYDNTNLTLSSTPHVHVRLRTCMLLHHHYYTTTTPPLHHHYIAGATTPTRARELELGPTRTLRGGRRHHNPTSTRQSFPCLVRSK